MAVPSNVSTQLTALNANVNILLADRSTLIELFDNRFGNSLFNLLSGANQVTVKGALVADMQSAVTALQNVVNTLAAM